MQGCKREKGWPCRSCRPCEALGSRGELVLLLACALSLTQACEEEEWEPKIRVFFDKTKL